MKKKNIAILGLGTVGYGVYDIVSKSEYLKDINVKYILDKDLSKQELVKGKVTNSIDEILNDNEVEVIIECMGAKDFSYYCIKESLLKGKSVVTANKEVVAAHIKELTAIKEFKNVSLYYEASVGGGIPIIKPLFNASLINDIDEIKGILNGTTNFILTKMTNEKMSFKDALKLAQDLGFAEADPTADLEGLDMVRKIAILSSIAYKYEVDPEKVYHYGITTLNEKDIEFAEKNNKKIKLLASSKLVGNEIELRIEPVLIEKGQMISSVDYEFNIIEVNCSYNDKLIFYGKGAGRYPTANAMVNDLIMVLNNDKNYTFIEEGNKSIKQLNSNNKYYLRVKDLKNINKDIIDIIDNNQIITKEINFKEINNILNDVFFYAKID